VTMTRTLWFRLALSASGFVIVVWLASSTLAFFLFQTRLVDSLDSSLKISAGQVLAEISVDHGTLNLADSLTNLNSLGSVMEGGFLAEISDASGKQLYRTGTLDISVPQRVRSISDPIVFQGKIMGTLRIFRGTEPVRTAMGQLLTTLLTVLPVSVLVTFLGSAWIVRRSLVPVEYMASQTSRISDSNLSERLPVGMDDELGRLAVVFNALLERLENAFEQEKRFTSDAAHELRTPLNAIQAIMGTTLSRPRDEATYRTALADIGQQVARLTSLTNDLLFLARGGRPTDEAFDLALLIGDVVAGLQPLAGEKGLYLRGAAGSVVVSGDRDALARALVNIVANGIRYTDNGGVTVSLSDTSAGRVIEVSDTGRGIDAAHRQHLFERFYRADPSRTDGGSGLGLALAKEIVERHGGRIDVDSRVGQGSTFRVVLP